MYGEEQNQSARKNMYVLESKYDFLRSSTLFGSVNDDISVGDYVKSKEGDIDKNKL